MKSIADIYVSYTCKHTCLTAKKARAKAIIQCVPGFTLLPKLSLFLDPHSYNYYQNINTPNQKRLQNRFYFQVRAAL